jgi:hypothetical protein
MTAVQSDSPYACDTALHCTALHYCSKEIPEELDMWDFDSPVWCRFYGLPDSVDIRPETAAQLDEVTTICSST